MKRNYIKKKNTEKPNNPFDKYNTDAEMTCVNVYGTMNNGAIDISLKGDTLAMSGSDLIVFRKGINLQQNGSKLEFIANAGFSKFM